MLCEMVKKNLNFLNIKLAYFDMIDKIFSLGQRFILLMCGSMIYFVSEHYF